MAEEKIFNVNQTHPVYKKLINKWKFYMDSYKGGDSYIKQLGWEGQYSVDNRSSIFNGSYLFPHELEFQYPSKFVIRHNRSVFDNLCAPVIDNYNKYIFNTQVVIKREKEEYYEMYIKNIDLRQNTINRFMQLVSLNMMIYGITYILVDQKPLPSNINAGDRDITVEQARDLGVRSFANLISPKQITNWYVNEQTNEYEFILVSSNYFPNAIKGDYSDKTLRYFYFTKDETYLLDDAGMLVKDDPNFLVNPKPNKIKMIPIIPCIYQDADVDGEPESALKDIAALNREIYNVDSHYQEEEYILATAQKIRQKASESEQTWEEGLEPSNKTDKATGPQIVEEYPFGADPPSYLRFPPDALQEKRERKKELKEQIMQIAGLIDSAAIDNSGISLSFIFSDKHKSIMGLAKNLEEIEQKMWNMIFKLDTNINNSENIIKVNYPGHIDVRSFEEQRRDFEIAKAQFKKSPEAMVDADMNWGENIQKWDKKKSQIIEKELRKGYIADLEDNYDFDNNIIENPKPNQSEIDDSLEDKDEDILDDNIDDIKVKN